MMDSFLRIIEENEDMRHVLYFKEYLGIWIARTLREAAKSVGRAKFFKTIKEYGYTIQMKIQRNKEEGSLKYTRNFTVAEVKALS